MHCTPITTARRKKQRLRLTKRVRLGGEQSALRSGRRSSCQVVTSTAAPLKIFARTSWSMHGNPHHTRPSSHSFSDHQKVSMHVAHARTNAAVRPRRSRRGKNRPQKFFSEILLEGRFGARIRLVTPNPGRAIRNSARARRSSSDGSASPRGRKADTTMALVGKLVGTRRPRAPRRVTGHRENSPSASPRGRALRCRASCAGARSRPADWPCRPRLSSPGRRTSRSSSASPSPAPPCRGSWR